MKVIGPMLLTSAFLAVPVMAANTRQQCCAGSFPADTTTENSPAADHNAVTGASSDHARPAAVTPAAAPTRNETPKYTTSDDQVRMGKVVGGSLCNDKDETVGSVDDILMSHTTRRPWL